MNRSRFRTKTTFDATSKPPGGSRYDSDASHPLQPLRDRILQNVLIGSVIFGMLAFISTLPPRLAERQYVLIAIFAASLLTVIIVTVYRRASYKIRVLSFLGLITVLGISTLISDGLFGNGRVFLIALPIIAALLISERAGLASLVLSIIIVALTGAVMLLGVIPAPASRLSNVNSDIQLWILALAVWVLVGGVTTISLVIMLRGMKGLVETEQRLRVELDSERSTLASRIQERTRDLERRLTQIRSAADISRSLGAVLEPDQLLHQAVDQLQRNFDLYFAGVYLVDENQEFAVLAAGSGEAGSRMVAEGYQLSLVEDSTVAWSINNQLPKIAVDVGRDSAQGSAKQSKGAQISVVRFNNPLLPFTRSEIILPIIITRTESAHTSGATGSDQQGQPLAAAVTRPSAQVTHVLGALVLQSTRSQAFDADDLNVLQGVATSLANALENANLFKQVQKNLQEIGTLNRQYLEQAWSMQDKNIPTGKLAAVSEDRNLLNKKRSKKTGEEQPAWLSVQVPLEVRDQVIGRLDVETPARALNETGLSAEDKAMIDTIVTEAALALENIRLLETTQRQAGFDRLLAGITSTARAGTDLDSILRSTVKELGKALNAAEAEIVLQVSPTPPAQSSSAIENEAETESELEPGQAIVPENPDNNSAEDESPGLSTA